MCIRDRLWTLWDWAEACSRPKHYSSRAELSSQLRTQCSSVPVALRWVAMSRHQRRPSRFARRQHNSPALIFHVYTAQLSGEVCSEALVQCAYTMGWRGQCTNYLHPLCSQMTTPFDNHWKTGFGLLATGYRKKSGFNITRGKPYISCPPSASRILP